ncbi:hypothetical protein IAD21_05895 [Abditibacteriota bacterium]|nr:hypothetical protein IAD21_05895 [Abditibacteriota bacterium]
MTGLLFSCLMTRFLLALLLGLPLSSCADPAKPLLSSVSPAQSTVFSSTREVRGLSWNGKTLWAATGGGVLRFENGKWTKWTRQEGLPANETFGVAADRTVRFPVATARFDEKGWMVQGAPPFQKPPLETTWRGQKVRASLDGLELGKRSFPLPKGSPGTHISALLPLKTTLQVAVYGDGLYSFNGAKWTRDVAPVPNEAREITALAGDGRTLWVGTRRTGIWRRQSGKWAQFIQAGEPFSHNVQFLARFRGVLWGSTLDDGVIYQNGTEWLRVATTDLSSTAPRQMLVWKDTLWVRHGTGIVDSFDGTTWKKDALGSIPRRGIYALGGDEQRLVASGWGGFAEWDGTTWTPHYDIGELKGVPILGILCDGDEVWLETQSRGAGLWNRASGAFKWLDERAGLPDDWVTALAKMDGKIYAGTFVGGLARLDGEKWFTFPELNGENVTSLCASGTGGVLAATRHGVWKIEGDKATKVNLAWLDTEDQALLEDENGVWIGARTSLNFWRLPTEATQNPT